MKTKGSITVFLSLTLTVVIALFCASLLSVRIACERAVCANAADQAVFSLLSEYDRDLLARYHVLFLDSGFSGGTADYASYIHFLEDTAEYIVHPGKGTLMGGGAPWNLSVNGCTLTAATCATQLHGTVFAMQAVSYMKDTAALGALSLIAEAAGSGQAAGYMRSGRAVSDTDLSGGMREVKNTARAKREAEAAAAAAEAEAAGEDPAAIAVEPLPEMEDNPVDTISDLKKSSILSLVIPEGKELSGKTTDLSRMPSKRSLSQSFGISCVTPLSVTEEALFREYLISHCGSFLHPSESALSYELEYILGGKNSDKENLEALAKSLVLLRTGANAAAIYADGSLHTQISTAALQIASSFAAPECAPVIEPLLAAGLAWCEAVTDVRAMLSGFRVPLIKSAATWQVPVSSVPLMLTAPDSLCHDAEGGLTYEAYLRILLALQKQNTSQDRLLDVAEAAVRTVCGRPDFHIDLSIDTVEAEFSVLAEDRVNLTVTRRASFREENLNT